MNLPPRILFIGAHCDDIELFAGGLLARACFDRRSVGVLVFSDHRGVVDEPVAARALAEFHDNLSWISSESGARVDDHSGDMLPACRGAFEAERGALYTAMEALRGDYDMVVTHSATDTNQDHRQVADEAARVFKAHATLIAGEFPNNDLGAFSPQLYVSLAPREVDAKVRMVANYQSQDFAGRPYLDPDLVRSLAKVRGAQIREVAAEAFAVAGRVVLRPGGSG